MSLKFVIINHFFYHHFLYMTDMIPVLEVTTMVPSFPQESKRTVASSLEKRL